MDHDNTNDGIRREARAFGLFAAEIRITGDTYKLRRTLRHSGLKWDAEGRSWVGALDPRQHQNNTLRELVYGLRHGKLVLEVIEEA